MTLLFRPANRRLPFLLFTVVLLAARGLSASIEDVRMQLDPATGKAKDTATAFGIKGIVSARATLDGGKVLAFVQPVGAAGVPILVTGTDAAKIVPRNEVTLTGTLGDGPLGFAVLLVKEGSVTVGQTNKAFGAAESRGADLFKDASSLYGRYVSLTNSTFVSPRFDGSGKIKVKADAGEVTVLVSKTLKDRDVPAGAVNVFGVPVKVNDEWCLLAARFLSVNNRDAQALGTKHTCVTCHNPDVKSVGPAFRDVAARYKDDPDAVKKMCEQIEKGGGGRWGTVPMPPLGAKVPPADREQLAQWIYGYRWDALLAE
jgi:cytochrome c551/c552